MRGIFLYVISLFIYTVSFAYIGPVGGEFQLSPINASGMYDIKLNVYYDIINGNKYSDDLLNGSIFRVSDDVLMDSIILIKESQDPLDIRNPSCYISTATFSKIVYSISYQFNNTYNDPQGYYIVVDRCCRLDSVRNIQNPRNVSLLYYLQFPSIYDTNGTLKNWSSPVFKELKVDYACLNQFFELDFGAVDPDNDSLVYSLVRPYAGVSTDQNGNMHSVSQPFSTIAWRSGMNDNNQIPGNPSLSIDPHTGILNVTPSLAGAFLFSVLCEEFRDGIKIGEVRRDYQIYVSAYCKKSVLPEVSILLPDGSLYNEFNGDTFVMSESNYQCFDLLIVDNEDDLKRERVYIEAVPVNFNVDYELIQEGEEKYVNGAGDTLKGWKLCPPYCDDIMDRPFIYDIIVKEDVCPRFHKDTIRFYLKVIAEPNEAPLLRGNNSEKDTMIVEVFELDTVKIDLEGFDLDNKDALSISAKSLNFRMRDFGMNFPKVSETGGTISTTFEWVLNCENIENANRGELQLMFLLDDNSCYRYHVDTLNVFIRPKKRNKNNFSVPNVFTPNKDGKNDVFFIKSLPKDVCGDEYVAFQIYNRFGRKVYETSSRNVEFEGDDLNDGLYYYLIEYTKSEYKGFFELLH